ncbi:MAG: ATP-binding protein [Fibrobacterota bacterium]
MYVKRDIETALKEIILQFPALALTGPRQTGKSTLLQNLFPDFTYCNLENMIDRQAALSDPYLFLERLGEPVIIDEIQYAPELTSAIKVVIDNDRDKRGRFILTGSQQYHLIRHLGDSLAGRIGIVELLPFCVHEQTRVPDRNGVSAGKSILDRFKYACLQGAYPELCVSDITRKGFWYDSYIRTYLERDVRSLINIGNLRDFEKFLTMASLRCGQLLNMSAMAHDLGLSVNTVKNWFSVLEASRLIYFLSPYHSNAGKRIVKSPKLYFTDCGLACYLAGIRDENYLLQGPMAGAMFENFWIQETLKVYFNELKRPRLYFLRTAKGAEVDLLIEGVGMTLYPVEFKLSATPRTAMAENISHLRKSFAKLNMAEGILLTLTDRNEPLTKDVRLMSPERFTDWLKEIII